MKKIVIIQLGMLRYKSLLRYVIFIYDLNIAALKLVHIQTDKLVSGVADIYAIGLLN